LYQQCATYNKRQNMSDGEALAFIGCNQYVAAVVDLLVLAPTLGGVQVCVPPNIQYDQAVDLTQAYLRDHPEVRHHSAAASVVVAMAQAFPCGK